MIGAKKDVEMLMVNEQGAATAELPGESDAIGMILRAAQFAAHKHRDQRRKDTDRTPYVNHPIGLATVLWEEGGVRDAKVLAAALLHDTLEDTETSFDELRGQFGDEVAGIVAEVTDTKWLSKRSRKALQVRKAAHSSHGARLVKLADKICNLRDILASPPAGWTNERRGEYFDWAHRVVDEIRGTHAGLEQRFDSLYRQRP